MNVSLIKKQLFSALYSMLPSSKNSLKAGGYSSKEAAWILVACFIGGVIGIQIVSRVIHKYMPHNVVDCEHSHEDEEAAHKEGENGHLHAHTDHDDGQPRSKGRRSTKSALPDRTPRTETLQRQSSFPLFAKSNSPSHRQDDRQLSTTRDPASGRPKLQSTITGTISRLTSGKDPSCDCGGPCYGYSDLCQTKCFKTITPGGVVTASKPSAGVHRPSAVKNATATESTPLLQSIDEESLVRPHTHSATQSHHGGHEHEQSADLEQGLSEGSSATAHEYHDHEHSHDESDHEHNELEESQHHHHHVPTNAFLSIGLQTSIAIALHKLPEGFITYATNHANPKLGFSVFFALFIHNITEGFAMALPLYLAINNRIKAVLISFALGGLSQPLGAGVAALWFHFAGNGGWAPNEAGNGIMFAITAGIMASVALQLFSEALELTHSKGLCMVGAFCGMAILGVSSALTA